MNSVTLYVMARSRNKTYLSPESCPEYSKSMSAHFLASWPLMSGSNGQPLYARPLRRGNICDQLEPRAANKSDGKALFSPASS